MATRVLTFGGGVRTGTFWFRCFGFGLKLKPPAAPPSFGEQHGLRRLVRLGGWRVCLLLPSARARQLA